MTTDNDFPDTMIMPRRAEPMPFEPVWYARRSAVAACKSNVCRSGRDACPTPDACRIPADDDGSDPDGSMKALAYLLIAVVAAIAGAAVFWPR